METIAQEAKRLLADVPDLSNVYGIWSRLYPQIDVRNERYSYLKGATKSLNIEHVVNDHSTLSDVIDGNCYSSYPQKTEKLRFMALLDDMISAGY